MGRRTPHNKREFVAVREEIVTKVPPPDLDLGRDWYLVFTAPRQEARAAQGLVEAGCEVFLPQLHRIIRFRRREYDGKLATFPRYLFASGLPSRRNDRHLVGPDGRTVITINGRPLTDIREIDGVVGVVGSAGAWERVQPRQIEAVARFQADGRPIFQPKAKLPLRPGESVRILDGPFTGFMATVVEELGSQEAEMLVSMFGREHPVRMPLEQIERRDAA